MLGRKYENLKQYRPAIRKSVGVTQSERYLAYVAEKSFLNLWCYPSPFRDQKQSKNGEGKELCDLLVVCGRYVIIFSEKTISWPGGELEVAWSRWFKRAVWSAAKQARGAERWITEFPERIFLDRKCRTKFPIDFPAREERIIHRVVVAKGTGEGFERYSSNSLGKFVIEPGIRSAQHWQNNRDNVKPFVVGDVDPLSSFVHVFGEVGMDVLMYELNTISDFAGYLEKRANFIRSGQLLRAYGEENLLAHYAVRVNEAGEHDFVSDTGQGEAPGLGIEIKASEYARLVRNPRYVAKKRAEEVSYLWDMLIETFTTHMLDGTSMSLEGYEFDLRKSELGVRYMALERRFYRRNHGEAVRGVLEKGKSKDIFFRLVKSTESSAENDTAFFFLTVKNVASPNVDRVYDEYRTMRSKLAQIYAMSVLQRFGHLKRVIGISLEPPDQGAECSEDMIYMEQTVWTDEERRATAEDCRRLGIMRDDLSGRYWKGEEYPGVDEIESWRPNRRTKAGGMNRQQRRAMAAIARRVRSK